MKIFLNDYEIEFLNKVIKESKYSDDERAKYILDHINKDIHVGDRVRVIKILATSGNYKKLLGKTGIVLKVDNFIDVKIRETIYYMKREELEVI